jgi:hypothetical protein
MHFSPSHALLILRLPSILPVNVPVNGCDEWAVTVTVVRTNVTCYSYVTGARLTVTDSLIN